MFFLIIIIYTFILIRVKISVEGYDTSIPAVDIGNALTSRFSSCGRICYLDIPRDPITNVVNGFAEWLFFF